MTSRWTDKFTSAAARQPSPGSSEEAEYLKHHHHPLTHITYVRLGSGYAYVKDGARLEDCGRTLAKAAYAINRGYDEDLEKHRVVLVGQEDRVFRCNSTDSFSLSDQHNLPEISCTLLMLGQNAQGEPAHMYIGIMLHKLTGLISHLAEYQSCNPTDHTGFLLASATGAPKTATQRIMAQEYHFDETCVLLNCALVL